jgi:hypothetical protein
MANGIGLMGESGQKSGGEVNDVGSVDYDLEAQLRRAEEFQSTDN